MILFANRYDYNETLKEKSELDKKLYSLEENLCSKQIEKDFNVYVNCSFLIGTYNTDEGFVPDVSTISFDFDSLPGMELFIEDFIGKIKDCDIKVDVKNALCDIRDYLEKSRECGYFLTIPDSFWNNQSIMRISVNDTKHLIEKITKEIRTLKFEIAQKEMLLTICKKQKSMKKTISSLKFKGDMYKINSLDDARFLAGVLESIDTKSEKCDTVTLDNLHLDMKQKFPQYVFLERYKGMYYKNIFNLSEINKMASVENGGLFSMLLA